LTERALQPAAAGGQADPLRAELRAAQEALRAAEAELAAEQAAVNAFRMHARLMLDDLADAILLLRARKQALLTELALAAADDDPLPGEAKKKADKEKSDKKKKDEKKKDDKKSSKGGAKEAPKAKEAGKPADKAKAKKK